jgi:voltage-gated sodium channel
MTMHELQKFFDRIRSNKVFEIFVVAVILFSAVMIGANSYNLDGRIVQVMGVLDLAVTLFFLFELTIRFLGRTRKTFLFSSWLERFRYINRHRQFGAH